MTDLYNILNVTFGATEDEIKKEFRKLAIIHHPDKNGGSKKSEESFKKILNAYEILYSKESRAIYDLKYKQHLQKAESGNHQNNTRNKKHKQPPTRKSTYKKTEASKPKVNYNLWIILILFALIYLYYVNKTTTTGNQKADKELNEQKHENRPQSGELDFIK